MITSRYVPNHVYVDGVVKLHELLSSTSQEAYYIAQQCVPGLSDNIDCNETITVFVDFKEEQPENALKGYFVFDRILFRFLTITFDYALLFPIKDHDTFDKFTNTGISLSDIEKMKRARRPLCISFSTFPADRGTPKLFRKIQALPLTGYEGDLAGTSPIIDEVGLPFTAIEEIKELRLIDIPQHLSSVQYTLVGKQYYAPYTTDKESYCVLFAMQYNEHDCNAIKVLRWFPISRQCALDSKLDEEVNWGDIFYELGYISRYENAELHSFMLSENTPLLFAKKLDNKISIIGGVKIFFDNDFGYPTCLLKIPVK